MKTVTLLLAIVAAASVYAAYDDIAIDRHSRRIQVDGFLLEWGSEAQNHWGGAWMWDAIITAEGVAGYLTSRDSAACPDWTFTAEILVFNKIVKAYTITLPEQPTSGNFAFDRDAFEKSGVYRVEWLAPMDAFAVDGMIFNDDNNYALVLNGASGCGDTLPALRLPVFWEIRPPVLLYHHIVLIGVAVIALAVMIIIARKRKFNPKHRRTAS